MVIVQDKYLKDAALSTPDPERSLRNMHSFCSANPDHVDFLKENIRSVSLLFSVSQFLANFASSNPGELVEAVHWIDEPLDRNSIKSALRKYIGEIRRPSGDAMIRRMRLFKKKALLSITLRDITDKTDIVAGMSELSSLAEAIVNESLVFLRSGLNEVYGSPAEDSFSVIAVGKLGSEELNFSSDIDLLYIYGKEAGESSGITTAGGITKNRISSHEYYSKLGESLNKFLSASTEDGFVYRVDLRLRPEGQKGSIALSLPAYETYYESWGRGWERAVLLRARFLAGDDALGGAFLEMIKPFIYRKYLDFNAVDEIRKMKTKIDERFKKDDIKRGYGGIREIEFFTHALQLLYGGKDPLLRDRGTLRGLHLLLRRNLIGYDDYSALSGNYLFLRKLEHRLQQLNDLQTHSLPGTENELTALAGKMGFGLKADFLRELEFRRRTVRKIYDSLFLESRMDVREEGKNVALLLSEDMPDSELAEIVGHFQVRDMAKAVNDIRLIRDGMLSFQTLRSRRLLAEVLPRFLSEALRSGDPNSALGNLQPFAALLSSEESYLDLFAHSDVLIPALTRVFALSGYLSRRIIKRRQYLEVLTNEMFAGRTLLALKNDLRDVMASGQTPSDAVRILIQMEEIRLGIMFLDGKIDVIALVKGLTKTAEAVVSVCVDELAGNGFAVIGMGKLGGREITFESDLDLIFALEGDIREDCVKAAERLIRLLTSYTKEGIAYKVDVRLRPDGTRGPLVSAISGLKNYYDGPALFWEIQALLKARPVAGDSRTASLFMEMRERTLKERGREVSGADIGAMRKRIQRELSKEKEGYDLKLGPGGIEELEFIVQYLQLVNGCERKVLFVQGTLDAVKRLTAYNILAPEEAELMAKTYILFRTIESLGRLRGEPVLRKTEDSIRRAADFTGFETGEEFVEHIEETRKTIRRLFEKYLG